MDTFVFLMIVIIVIAGMLILMGRARILRAAALQNAYADYQKALTALKREPTNPDRKRKALDAGRAYASATRENKGTTTFDEMALSNDIAAATAGATAAAPTAVPVPAVPTKGDVGERLAKLDALKAQGIVTEAEHQAQRAKILADL